MRISLGWRLAMAIVLAAGLPGGLRRVVAQSGPRVQAFTGTVDDVAEIVFYHLSGLHGGETLYVYAEATDSNLDTYLAVADIDFTNVLAEDDDSGGGTDSALSYTIPADGDYSLAVTRYDESSSGTFRLWIGIDAPDVLSGTAQPTGDEIAVFSGAVPSEGYDLGGGSLEATDCSVLEARPALSGPEERLETGYFVVHYTTTGRDGATGYYAQEVANVIDRIWKFQVSEFGWPAPPTDCGEGGDTRYDVYLLETLSSDSTMGYSMPEAVLGDNPNTPAVEDWSTYSYLAIDNDFDSTPASLSLMRTTAAHEFNHSIQFGYDLNDIGGEWYYEATATWMETITFPEDEDATPYVPDLFMFPDLCIGATPDDPKYDTRIYAEWLLIDSLAQDYGPQVVRRLWELIAVEEGMDSFYTSGGRAGHDAPGHRAALRHPQPAAGLRAGGQLRYPRARGGQRQRGGRSRPAPVGRARAGRGLRPGDPAGRLHLQPGSAGPDAHFGRRGPAQSQRGDLRPGPVRHGRYAALHLHLPDRAQYAYLR